MYRNWAQQQLTYSCKAFALNPTAGSIATIEIPTQRKRETDHSYSSMQNLNQPPALWPPPTSKLYKATYTRKKEQIILHVSHQQSQSKAPGLNLHKEVGYFMCIAVQYRDWDTNKATNVKGSCSKTTNYRLTYTKEEEIRSCYWNRSHCVERW